MAALEMESRYGLEDQQTSVQKQTHLLCPFSFQFSLETIYCFFAVIRSLSQNLSIYNVTFSFSIITVVLLFLVIMSCHFGYRKFVTLNHVHTCS